MSVRRRWVMLLLDRAYSTALLEDAVGGAEQWLATRDDADPTERGRGSDEMDDGLRLQRSVFQVQSLRPQVLIEELGGHMDLNRDVLQMFRQCRACEDASIGIGQFGPSLQERWWVA